MLISSSLQAREIVIDQLVVNERYLIERKDKLLTIRDNLIGYSIVINQLGQMGNTRMRMNPGMEAVFGPNEEDPKIPIAVDLEGSKVVLYSGATNPLLFGHEVRFTAFAQRTYHDGQLGWMGTGEATSICLNDILMIDANFVITLVKGGHSYRFAQGDEVAEEGQVSIFTCEKKDDEKGL